MKRFLAFAYEYYEPCGGADDLFDSFDDLEQAISEAKAKASRINSKPDHADYAWHVLDTATGAVANRD